MRWICPTAVARRPFSPRRRERTVPTRNAARVDSDPSVAALPQDDSLCACLEASWLGRRDDEVVEFHHAVGLRPDADFARHRLGEREVEELLAVEEALKLHAVHCDLERMLGPELQGDVLGAALHELSLAGVERPQDDVVFRAVEAHGEIVAVRLDVEEDAGAPIERTADHLKAYGDLAVLEVVDPLRHGDGEVGERLDALDELLVPRAIDCAGLVSQAARGLPALPFATIHE